MTFNLTEMHLRVLVNNPNSQTSAKLGGVWENKDNINSCGELKNLGMLQLHDNNGKPTWTRTRAGDLAVAVALKHLNEYIGGK